MTQIRLRWLLIILALFALLLFLQYRLWFEADGINDMWKLKKMLSAQKIENENLKKRNQELSFQIHRLQNNKEDALETNARDELGMIKKGETFYQVVKIAVRI